jgi:hypothetical protein
MFDECGSAKGVVHGGLTVVNRVHFSSVIAVSRVGSIDSECRTRAFIQIAKVERFRGTSILNPCKTSRTKIFTGRVQSPGMMFLFDSDGRDLRDGIVAEAGKRGGRRCQSII